MIVLEETKNKNSDMVVNGIKMNCDETICDNKNRTPPYPLMKSSFAYILNGSPGSGKSTLLMHIITKKNKNGKKLSYRGCFDDIIFVSPSMNTLPKTLDDLDYKFDRLDEDVLDIVEEVTQKNIEDNAKDKKPCKQTLLILDDVGSQIRRNKEIETRLSMLINNRRHKRLSVILVSQNLIMIPPSIRKAVNLLFLFLPKNRKEKQLILDEYVDMNRKEFDNFINFVFQQKRDFLIIDMSLRQSSNIDYFRNFNKIKISRQDKDAKEKKTINEAKTKTKPETSSDSKGDTEPVKQDNKT